MTKQPVNNEAANEEAVANTNTVSLSLQDLNNCISIIDVAANRGAFRGNELSQVGGVRDKIAAVIVALTPPEVAEAQAAAQTEATETEAAETETETEAAE